jgi:Flp pilus assembly protein TadG
VELAVVLPILVLLLGGIVDGSRLLLTSLRLTSAAQAGALYGSQANAFSNDSLGIRSAALANAPASMAMTVTSTRECRCPSGAGDALQACFTTATPPVARLCTGYGAPRVYVRITTTATVPVLLLRPLYGASRTISRSMSFRSA